MQSTALQEGIHHILAAIAAHPPSLLFREQMDRAGFIRFCKHTRTVSLFERDVRLGGKPMAAQGAGKRIARFGEAIVFRFSDQPRIPSTSRTVQLHLSLTGCRHATV
jgi:hypothetical protein